ncbi:c-type cytochrome domain-containing protein [Verrucomicrobium spinosum]|uniref:c-type cytochrome domain-containing protein n=1 Tax=Verrucomicrobium spinosum TaxID=2736 RepID=UPI0012F630DB|nr:c-type cytochrome domain-containing protein [Verrucomicrobium spinosum]
MPSLRHLSAFPVMALAGIHAAPAPVDYDARVMPLFQEHCVDCHAADDADGEFALDTFDALIKGGKAGKPVVPGDAQNSLLVKFLEGRSGREGKNQFMPPGKKEHLKPEEIAIIRQWIDAGAHPPAAPGKPADALATLPKISPRTAIKKSVLSLSVSAPAKLVVAGGYGSVRLIDPNSLQTVREMKEVAGKVNAVAFSADGAFVFAAAGTPGVSGVAYQWKTTDGSLVRKLEGHSDALYGMAISPDGKLLATGSYDQKIKLWDLSTGAEVRALTGHNSGVFGLAFRPDGKVLASASADRTVKLWEVATGRRLDTFSQPLKEQTAVAFSPDGRLLAAGGADNRLRVWKVSAEAVEGTNQLLATRYAHEGAILSVGFEPGGKQIFTSAADRTAKIWNSATYIEEHLMDQQSDWVPAMAALGGDKLLEGRLDGSLAVYLISTGLPATPAPATPKPMAKSKPAPAAKPELVRLEPRGVQSGTRTTLKVTGKNLQGLSTVKLGHADLKASVVSVNQAETIAEIEIEAGTNVPRTQVDVSLVTAGGETAKQRLLVDYLPQLVGVPSDKGTRLPALPVNVWGTLRQTGQVDAWIFGARKGETVIFDLAAARIESKAVSPRLEVVDADGRLLAANNGLDSGSDPFVAFTAPADGEYKVLVREITLAGSEDHVYRLTAGVLPYVTGWWPLAVPPNQESRIELVGYNLKDTKVMVTSPAEGEVSLPLDSDQYRSRVNMRAQVSPLPQQTEQDPNDAVANGPKLTVPSLVNARLQSTRPGEPDADLFPFEATKGQQLVFETRAAMLGSPADTKLEILDVKGELVPMIKMQATKDSWITLRSEDANDPAIRLGRFAEMELNDYMYFNGEVLKIYRLARGPDADMIYYAGAGKRKAFFNTSPAGHGLDDLCYAVEPRALDARIVPNGLPVFTLYYMNDDDGERKLGRDSRLTFVAPADGTYQVRVSDTRGWSSERQAYQLIVRDPRPDFSPRLLMPATVSVPAGSGVQLAVTVDRDDGFEGPVQVELSGVPDGFYVSTPIVVEGGHLDAAGALYARPEAKMGIHDFSGVKVTAKGIINGREVVKEVNGLPKIAVAAAGKRSLFVEPDMAGKPAGDGKTAPGGPYEITIEPGKLVSAWLRVDRRGDDALIGVDIENLPHGVIVDNIGLNGVQIRAGESEREVFLSCAPWVAEQDRLCHMVVGSARNDAVKADAAATSFPVLLKVRKKPDSVARE